MRPRPGPMAISRRAGPECRRQGRPGPPSASCDRPQQLREHGRGPMDVAITGATLIFASTLVVSLAGLFIAPALSEKAVLRPYWLVRRRDYERLVTSVLVHADL